MSRESGIEKKIEIVFNLGNYESVRVGATFTEKVSWENPAERQEKAKKIQELLVKEIKQDIFRMSEDLCLKQRLTDYSNAFDAVMGGGKASENNLDEVSDDGDFDIE